MTRVINFGAGPSALPESVLKEAAQGLLNFENTGIGITEISHRSKEFSAYQANVQTLVRQQLNVPLTHDIFLLQGGGTGQFSAVVLNMLARHHLLHPEMAIEDRVMDYIVTGNFSNSAYKEAGRLAGGATVNIVVDARDSSSDGKSYDHIPSHGEYQFSEKPALIYYCENETANGVQFSHDEKAAGSFPFHLLPEDKLLPLVADYSSSFMSRPIPRIADHAIIFAGAQKNIGPAGLTIVIVRNDCIVDVDAAARFGAIPVPIGLAYKNIKDKAGMPNTPAVFSVYVAGLVLKRNQGLGGVTYYEKLNRKKQEKLYAALKEGEEKGILKGHVKPDSRSWMNVVFEVIGKGTEIKFLAGAEKQGIKGIKGHRSVGGIRVSLYNAITEEQTDKIVAYIRQFLEECQPPLPSHSANP